MLKERDADRTLLYCHASADEEAAADARRHGRNQWLLVTSKSDVPSVLACNTFKLTPRPSGHKESGRRRLPTGCACQRPRPSAVARAVGGPTQAPDGR